MIGNYQGLVELCRDNEIVLLDTTILCDNGWYREARRFLGVNRFGWSFRRRNLQGLVDVVKRNNKLRTNPSIAGELINGQSKLKGKNKDLHGLISLNHELAALLIERGLPFEEKEWRDLSRKMMQFKKDYLSHPDHYLIVSALRCAQEVGKTALVSNDGALLHQLPSYEQIIRNQRVTTSPLVYGIDRYRVVRGELKPVI